MRWWSELKFIIRKLNRRRAESELEEEMRTHLELEAEEQIADGRSPQAASHAAHRIFGNVLISREKARSSWGFGRLESWWKDVRYSGKALSRSPGYTIAAVITLGLGIGVNSTIYSGINAILFRPLAGVTTPEQLCRINLPYQSGDGFEWVPYPEYLEIMQSNRSLTGLAAYVPDNMEIGLKGQLHQTMRGEVVSGNYFQVLGVRPALGRMLMPEDDQYGSGNAIVLGNAVWRNQFAADPEIIGKEITIENHGFIIAGVAPANFHGAQPPTDTGFWITITKGADLKLLNMTSIDPDDRGFSLLGRIKPDIHLNQVKAEMELFFANFGQIKPRVYQNRYVDVISSRGFGLSRGDGKLLLSVGGIVVTVVGILLLITCANVAGLQLTRAMTRRKEIAVRLALGASRRRVMRLLLADSILTALLGGVLAIALSYLTTAILGQTLSMMMLSQADSETVGMLLDFSPDWYVFAVTLVLSIAAGFACGLVPALQSSKGELTAAMKSEATLQTMRNRRLSWHNALIVMQVAGTIVLLITAGLFLHSFRQTMQIDPGFQPENLFFTKIMIGRNRSSPTQNTQFFQELQRRAMVLPNVKSVAVGEGPLLEGGTGRYELWPEGAEQKPFGDERVNGYFTTPKFLETVGISLLAGRDFNEQDLSNWSNVAVINKTIAVRAFPGQNPIGRRLRLSSGRNRKQGDMVEVIGVVEDSKYGQLWEDPLPLIYRPVAHYSGFRSNYMAVFVRTNQDPTATLPAMAKLIHSIDPEVSFTQLTMEESLRNHVLLVKVASSFFAIFGVMGLMLASVGLLGVMGFSVVRRTREIGIRMALGADRNKIVRKIIGEGLALTLVGIVIGLLAAVGLTHALSGFIIGINHLDPLSYGGTIVVMITATLIACYFPARRASKVDPMIALRCE